MYKVNVALPRRWKISKGQVEDWHLIGGRQMNLILYMRMASEGITYWDDQLQVLAIASHYALRSNANIYLVVGFHFNFVCNL